MNEKGKIICNLKALPCSPGVYFFYGGNKKVLYVGKAGNLRDRVRSYFKGHDERETVSVMLPQIKEIRVRKTDTVLETLILESHLIKKLQPKYNAMGKDDKSFCYYVVTREDFPRILISRATDIAQISNLSAGWQGSQFLISNKAPKQKIPIKKTYGPFTSKKQMEIALKILRKIFPFHNNSQKTEKGCLDFQIGRCPGPYAGAISHADYMKNIRGIRMILERKKKNLLKKLEKEMKIYAKNSEFEKAAEARNKLFALRHIQDVSLIASDDESEIQNLKSEKIRIEGYDISNISRQYATGSMVVFRNNKPDKSQYRKFRIKTIKDSDDVGMMKEVLIRRFKNDWAMPDLILLDGGKGHLYMAEKLLHKLRLAIPLMAVAKGPTRKISNFQFLTRLPDGQVSKQIPITKFPNLKNIIANKNLIKQIMDEAHRFAIRYHRKLRDSHNLNID